MDVLCTDKTGTLTEGVVQLEGTYTPAGESSSDVLTLAALNAALETGLNNPLDEAILRAMQPDVSRVHKVGELPFDFVRKRVGVVIETDQNIRLITKGAFDCVLDVCTQLTDGSPLDEARRSDLRQRYETWTTQGISRPRGRRPDPVSDPDIWSRRREGSHLSPGSFTFFDQPKQGAAEAIADLTRLGVAVKLITGDSKLVAKHVATLVPS